MTEINYLSKYNFLTYVIPINLSIREKNWKEFCSYSNKLTALRALRLFRLRILPFRKSQRLATPSDPLPLTNNLLLSINSLAKRKLYRITKEGLQQSIQFQLHCRSRNVKIFIVRTYCTNSILSLERMIAFAASFGMDFGNNISKPKTCPLSSKSTNLSSPKDIVSLTCFLPGVTLTYSAFASLSYFTEAIFSKPS